MLSQAEANSLACFRSLLQAAAHFYSASKVAVTWANQLPMVTESSGEALSIMTPYLEHVIFKPYKPEGTT